MQEPLQRRSGRRLRNAMRLFGVVLIAASIFFLAHDIAREGLAPWFFGSVAGLGFILFVSSWLPDPRRKSEQHTL